MDPVTKTCKAEGESQCVTVNHAGCVREQEVKGLYFEAENESKNGHGLERMPAGLNNDTAITI